MVRRIFPVLRFAALAVATLTFAAVTNAQDDKAPNPNAVKIFKVELKQATPKSKAILSARHRENYVGVFTEALAKPLASQLSGLLPPGQGLLVTGVMPGSPAAKAGIRKDDVLAKYDDQKLFNTEQFRQLIVGGKAGSAVNFQIVRQAKLETVKLTLAQRTMLSPNRPEAMQIIRIPGDRKLFGDKGIIVVRQPSQKGTAGSAGAADKDEAKAKGSVKSSQFGGVSIAITSQDGKTYQLEASYTNKGGNLVAQTLEGTTDEIRRHSGDLPADVRSRVKESLDRIEDATTKGKPSFRFQIRPQIEGTKRRLQLRLQQPGEGKGALRILELDLGVLGLGGGDIEKLLKSERLNRELKQLPPEIRKRIESTLRKSRIPAPKARIRQSQ